MGWQDRDYAQFDPHGGGSGFGLFASRAGSKFGDNPLNWSPSVGSAFGIRIRVHITFILYMVFELLSAGAAIGLIARLLAIQFGSVLLHEFGHCFAARSVNGGADDILMWPLGGLASVDAPRRPWPQFVTVICGPLVNVALMILAAPLVFVLGGRAGLISIDPSLWLLPGNGLLATTVWLVFYVNSFLFVFNLLPMYPMDGGRILHCALWHKFGYQRGTLITTTVGMVAAVAVGLYALVNKQYILLAIAFMGYITCYQERMLAKAGVGTSDNEFGYDFSGGYSTLDGESGKKPGFFTAWKQKRAQSKWKADREKQAKLQDQVDVILDKVKNNGIGSLTGREKKMLEEATRQQKAEDRRHGL